MKISYEYSFSDFEAINRSRRRGRKLARLRDFLLLILVIINFAIGIWFISLQLRAGQPLGLLSFANIAIGGLIIVGYYFFGPLYRRWYLRQQMMENTEVELQFSENEIAGKQGENTMSTQWPGIIQADEDETHYVLWLNKIQAYAIPKKAFEPAMEQEFRKLVSGKVKNRTFDI